MNIKHESRGLILEAGLAKRSVPSGQTQRLPEGMNEWGRSSPVLSLHSETLGQALPGQCISASCRPAMKCPSQSQLSPWPLHPHPPCPVCHLSIPPAASSTPSATLGQELLSCVHGTLHFPFTSQIIYRKKLIFTGLAYWLCTSVCFLKAGLIHSLLYLQDIVQWVLLNKYF